MWAILGHMAAVPDVWPIVINCQLWTHVTNALALGVVHVYYVDKQQEGQSENTQVQNNKTTMNLICLIT